MKLFSLNELFFYMATIIHQQIIAILFYCSSSSILLLCFWGLEFYGSTYYIKALEKQRKPQ